MVFQSVCDKVFGTIEELETHKKDCEICSEARWHVKLPNSLCGCLNKDDIHCGSGLNKTELCKKAHCPYVIK